MTEKRTAKPADAKAVWDSFVAKNEEPSVRLVATAMNASGQFHKIHPSTIGRWKRAGWKATKNGTKPTAVKNAAQISALVPALTGNSETRTEDVTGDKTDTTKKKDGKKNADLDGKSAAELAQLTVEELFKTAIAIAREIREKPDLALSNPEQIGGLQTALAGSLGSTTESFAGLLAIQDQLMKTISGTVINSEADPLKEALAAFEAEENGDGA